MPRLSRNQVVLVVAAIALAGANAVQYVAAVINYFFTDQLPDSSTFHAVFFFVFLPVGIVSVCSALAGGYIAIRSGRLPALPLIAFGVLLFPVLRVDHVELAWSALRIGWVLGSPQTGLGFNVAGVAFLLWLGLSLGEPPRSREPVAGHEDTGGEPREAAPSN